MEIFLCILITMSFEINLAKLLQSLMVHSPLILNPYAATAWIIKDSSGVQMHQQATKIHVLSPLQVEAMVCLHALKHMHSIEIAMVSINTESLLLLYLEISNVPQSCFSGYRFFN